MRNILIVIFSLLASTVHAHVGHLADAAGHDHWAIGAAIGAIALAGLLGALKGKAKDEAGPEDDEGEPA